MAITITALGDSTTWGYNSGNQIEKNMVTTAQEELSKALNSSVDIINRGQNSTTLGDAIANGNLYSAASDPSNIVILNYGMNEAYRREDPAQFRQNLLDAAGYLQSLGKKVVLQTPNFTSNPDIPNVGVYADIVREVGGQYGLAVDDKYSATQNAEFSKDDLTHPTAQVYQQLGRSLASTLQPIVSSQAQVATQQPLAAQTAEGLTPTAQQFSGLFSSGKVLEDQAQQVLAASGKANDPRFADAIVGSFVQDGVTYNVQGDGSIQGIIETPTGAYLAGGFTPTGQQATEQLSTRFEETDLDRALGVLANAAIAAGTAAGLGPAGVGLMSVPAAAATGAGFTSFANSGDLAQALRAAALAGTTAFGLGELFPAGATAPVDDFIAADVAQLAAQGIPEEQIAQILAQEGISNSVISAALDAQFGTSAPGSARGLGTPSTPSGAEQVAVTGQNVSNLGALSSLAPALATFAPTQTLSSIQVTGQTVKPDLTVPEAVSAALPVVSGGTVQQVGVTGQTIPKTEPVAPASAAVGSIIPGIQPAVPSAAEQVQVTGKKETPPDITIPTLSAALPAIPAAVKATLPEPVKPPAKKEDSLFQPSDILKLLTLLGGTAAVGGTGSGTIPIGSVPPSDRMIGSTTPQFGPDYYAAVQRYYNAYMPETPRNVAGPLQQWYENKYGA
jgi:lysophospholipase L1-like esterase